MASDYSIPLAYDKKTGERIDIDELENIKQGYEMRKRYNEGEFIPICVDCKEDLVVSTSKNERVHFRHNKGSESSCELKNKTWNWQEKRDYAHSLASKESPRHKQLKNYIGNLIKSEKECRLIGVDDRFLSDDIQKRRPDVYFEFKGYPIVFEIQLSRLSQKYILGRHNFYRKNGIYLIWLLDEFNLKNQLPHEKDIKYLSSHQNFFKINEQKDSLSLQCQYKYSFFNGHSVISKWDTISIGLNDLKFDRSCFQAYYFNFENDRLKKQQAHTKMLNDERKKRIKDKRAARINDLVDLFREYYKDDFKFRDIQLEIRTQLRDLDDIDLKELNNTLGFDKIFKGEPFIHHLIIKSQDHLNFLLFLLGSRHLDFRMDLNSSAGKSILITVLELEDYGHREALLKAIFWKGYCLTSDDLHYLNQRYSQRSSDKYEMKEYMAIKFYNDLKTQGDIDALNSHHALEVMLTIKSIIDGQIIGSKITQFHQLVINAIDHYTEYWCLIDDAITSYDKWYVILEGDKKDTLRRKINQYNQSKNKISTKLNSIAWKLFPEIVINKSTDDPF